MYELPHESYESQMNEKKKRRTHGDAFDSIAIKEQSNTKESENEESLNVKKKVAQEAIIFFSI